MGQNRPQKLVLSRETMRDLTRDELVGIQGGKNSPPTAGGACHTSDDTNAPCDICILSVCPCP